MSRRTRRSEGDVPTIILNKLPKQFSSLIPEETRKAVLIKAREKIRVLDSKTTRGVAICAGDSQDIRAAVILEILLREGVELKNGSRTPSIRIPLEQLGKVVGKGKMDTERVSNAVRNLLEKTPTSKNTFASTKYSLPSKKSSATHISLAELRAKPFQVGRFNTFPESFAAQETKNALPSTKKNDIKSKKRKQSEREKPQSTSMNHDIHVQPVHLFELCMRLQSKIFDPNACHKVSTMVYKSLVTKMFEEEGKTAVTRKAIMDDLQMNSKQFEGACLFLVNKKLDGGVLYDDSSNKKKSIAVDSDDEDAVLTIDDVANELRLETGSFEKFVKEISVKIADLMKDMNRQYSDSRKNGRKQSLNDELVGTDDIIKSFQEPHEIEDNEENIFASREPRNCKPMFINFDEYSQWKQNILSQLVINNETVDEATSRAALEISKSILGERKSSNETTYVVDR